MKYNQIEDLSTIAFNKTKDILNLINEYHILSIEQKSFYRQKLISFFSKYLLEDNLVSTEFLINNIDENFKDLFNDDFKINNLDKDLSNYLKIYKINKNQLYTATSNLNLNITEKQIFETLKSYIVYILKNKEINFDNFYHEKYDFDYIYKSKINRIKLSKEAIKNNRDYFMKKAIDFVQANYDNIFLINLRKNADSDLEKKVNLIIENIQQTKLSFEKSLIEVNEENKIKIEENNNKIKNII